MPVEYTAIVLNQEDSERLKIWTLNYLHNIHESDLDWELLCHHSTINLGTIPIKYYQHLGKEVKLHATHIAHDDNVIALKVEGNSFREEGTPHITLAINTSNGGKPVMSNYLEEWRDISDSIIVYGKVKEIRRAKNQKYYYQENKKTPAVIFDLDGTISKLNGRSPYEYHLSSNDIVNEKVAQYVRDLYVNDINIIILSGRGLASKAITKEWLKNNNIPYTELYLKPDNDRRKSLYYKEDILIKEIFPKYEVIEVLDDYLKNLKMFNEFGLKLSFVDSKSGEIYKDYNIETN